MASGRLSLTEKYAIQGMVNQGIDVSEIASQLGRKTPTIQKYIDGELSELTSNIATAQLQSTDIPQSETTEVLDVDEHDDVVVLSEQMYNDTLYKLRNAGMELGDAREILDRTVRKLLGEPATADEMYGYCLRNLNAKDVMVTRSAGGRKGVAMMTKAASERGDESKNRPRQPGRGVRGRIFRPKDNQMADG